MLRDPEIQQAFEEAGKEAETLKNNKQEFDKAAELFNSRYFKSNYPQYSEFNIQYDDTSDEFDIYSPNNVTEYSVQINGVVEMSKEECLVLILRIVDTDINNQSLKRHLGKHSLSYG